MKRIAVFLAIFLVLIAMAACKQPSVPDAPAVPSSAESPASTEKDVTEASTPEPQKVFFASLGDVFWPLDPKGKRFVAYVLGFYDVPGPGPEYPLYYFPLAIEKDLEGKNVGVIGTIQDPNIEEIGRSWETIINDAEQNVVCKVKLTRVKEDYKYKIEFYVSPDGGKQWFSPTTFPAD